MVELTQASPAEILESRLSRGAELLFDMELRGDTNGEYDRYFRLWEDLLEQYEALQAA